MTMPTRIQLSRAKGWQMPPNTVKVDRTTGFGNPFPVAKGASTSMGVTKDNWRIGTWSGPALWFRDSKKEALDLSVAAFDKWAKANGLAKKAVIELRGKNLACWCALDAPCHADVLLEMANAPYAAKETKA